METDSLVESIAWTGDDEHPGITVDLSARFGVPLCAVDVFDDGRLTLRMHLPEQRADLIDGTAHGAALQLFPAAGRLLTAARESGVDSQRARNMAEEFATFVAAWRQTDRAKR
jgi:hypothetical protein